jgi:hypothetical protein
MDTYAVLEGKWTHRLLEKVNEHIRVLEKGGKWTPIEYWER